MKQSLSYYITLLVIKLKGIKNSFSKDPINVKKIRKDDVYSQKSKFFRENTLSVFKVSDTLITEVGLNKNSPNLIIFIHGGAFISGPAKHHWDTVKAIAKQTNHKIWLCQYPKAPENKITKISANIDHVYTQAIENYAPDKISLIGDSVGGTLVTTLIQRLNSKNTTLPGKIILISPVMDATIFNSEIESIDPIDPMLSKKGVLSAKKMCAGTMDLKNVMMSPLYGCFNNFPRTVLFLAQNDITYPDQKIAAQKLIEAIRRWR
ncbi:alpha/beta hydrolase fold domain-containing protein [Aquimarina intermedia]|uniref:Alpha/beta hydrolase family protein n=1 Tax=Aquimarina intermedia TaxID=350814 RepID=A0A5S5BYK1_9FLAO|nr:alpha/beta hydrolase [Aquimarina intermedia]TYP72127.1 alpha/beta hydrolase family protein [Aquimarina intermedia]